MFISFYHFDHSQNTALVFKRIAKQYIYFTLYRLCHCLKNMSIVNWMVLHFFLTKESSSLMMMSPVNGPMKPAVSAWIFLTWRNVSNSDMVDIFSSSFWAEHGWGEVRENDMRRCQETSGCGVSLFYNVELISRL